MDVPQTYRCLELALVDGWKEFQQSAVKQHLREYFQFLIKAGFYESPFRTLFPNPAYDVAAKEIGRRFLLTAADLGIAFETPFPGDFSKSQELRKGENPTRTFMLRGIERIYPACPNIVWSFKITFVHSHDVLDFPEPPSLSASRNTS